MKRGPIILVAVVLCAVALVVWWRESGGLRSAERAELERRIRDAKNGEAVILDVKQTQSVPGENAAERTPAERTSDYAEGFRSATDYLEYARSLLGPARAGDHAAQYYLYRASQHCTDEYNLYFKRRGIRHSLDDALRMAAEAGWPFDAEVVRRAYNKCHALVEANPTELGKPRDWLRLASEGGFPLAQVLQTRNLERDIVRSNEDEIRKQQRELLAKAIQSRDPEVVWEISNVPLVDIYPDGVYEHDDVAWQVAACQRGFDCSPDSEAMRWLCLYDRACQPWESVIDVYRRARGDEMPELEARARQINEKIDGGDWAALGF